MGEGTKKYHQIVKQRLAKWRERFKQDMNTDLNFSMIAEDMRKRFKLETTARKLVEMFDVASDREVKLAELVALCQIYDIPLWDVCGFNVTTSELDIYRLMGKKGDASNRAVRQLNNSFYEGNYFCYYFVPKHYTDNFKPLESDRIREAFMKIRIENGRTIITLEENNDILTFEGERRPSFKLTGSLHVFENADIAHALISDEDGRRFMSLMFNFINLSTDVRYFMTIGTLTWSLNHVHEPLFQKMAAFRIQQNIKDPEVSEIIRGILALNTSPIAIDEETYDKIKDSDEIMKKFLSADKIFKKTYLFSESELRSITSSMAPEKKTEAILKLKAKSMYPTHEIVSETDSFTEFIKVYQQKQMLKHDEKKEGS